MRKTDNLRIARCCGATIVSRTDELTAADVGTGCGLFEIRKYGEEYFMFLEECADPKACTILLRGGSKDVLMEFERNLQVSDAVHPYSRPRVSVHRLLPLQDAMLVARNVLLEPKLLPGGGATEMAISVGLAEKAKSLEGVEAWPFKAVGQALEVIPRTLAQNAGADVVRRLTELRAAKANGGNPLLGVDGDKGVLADMGAQGVWDPYQVRKQTLTSAVEAACMLLRIDDILSGIKNKQFGNEDNSRKPAEELDEQGGGGRED